MKKTNLLEVIVIISVLLLFSGCKTTAKAVQLPESKHNVGFTMMDIRDETGAVFTVAVFYPTDAPTEPVEFGSTGTGNAAVDAPIAADGPLPAIVYSHGMGGCGFQDTALLEEFAEHDIISIAYDGPDAMFCSMLGQSSSASGFGIFLPGSSGSGFGGSGSFGGSFGSGSGSGGTGGMGSMDSMFQPRVAIVKKIIDYLQLVNQDPSSPFNGKIGKIGVVGHSLGGGASLQVAMEDSRVEAVVVQAPFYPTVINFQVPAIFSAGASDNLVPSGVSSSSGMMGGGQGSMPTVLQHYEELNSPNKYFVVYGSGSSTGRKGFGLGLLGGSTGSSGSGGGTGFGGFGSGFSGFGRGTGSGLIGRLGGSSGMLGGSGMLEAGHMLWTWLVKPTSTNKQLVLKYDTAFLLKYLADENINLCEGDPQLNTYKCQTTDCTCAQSQQASTEQPLPSGSSSGRGQILERLRSLFGRR